MNQKGFIDRNQTGLACEFLVAGELFRRKWDVTISFGSTKKFDLLAIKNNSLIKIQVKGIHYIKTGNWNIDKSKLEIDENLYIVFVNLNADKLDSSIEFFILHSKDAYKLITDQNREGNPVRNYIPYNRIKNSSNDYSNKWNILEETQNPITI